VEARPHTIPRPTLGEREPEEGEKVRDFPRTLVSPSAVVEVAGEEGNDDGDDVVHKHPEYSK
jgi:hypothetical protein